LAGKQKTKIKTTEKCSRVKAQCKREIKKIRSHKKDWNTYNMWQITTSETGEWFKEEM